MGELRSGMGRDERGSGGERTARLTEFLLLRISGSRQQTLCFVARWLPYPPYFLTCITSTTCVSPLRVGGSTFLLYTRTRGAFHLQGIVCGVELDLEKKECGNKNSYQEMQQN